MTLGHGALSEYALGEVAPAKAAEAIASSELLPADAKKAVTDFIKESFKELWNSFEDLININPPSELIEYWDIVIEIIKSLM